VKFDAKSVLNLIKKILSGGDKFNKAKGVCVCVCVCVFAYP